MGNAQLLTAPLQKWLPLNALGKGDEALRWRQSALPEWFTLSCGYVYRRLHLRHISFPQESPIGSQPFVYSSARLYKETLGNNKIHKSWTLLTADHFLNCVDSAHGRNTPSGSRITSVTSCGSSLVSLAGCRDR